MRRLSTLRPARGLTLVELLVGLTITGLLMLAGMPYYGQYMANTRLRESGNVLLGEALYAQSEAVKRNSRVSVVIGGNLVTVKDVAGNTDLRSRKFTDGISAGATDTTIVFGGEGRPVPFGTAASVDLTLTGFTCSNDIRCPGLRVDGGGGIRVCANTLATC